MREGFWDDSSSAQDKMQYLSCLKTEVEQWDSLFYDIQATLEIAVELSGEQDEELRAEIEKKTKELEMRFSDLEFFVFFKDKFDSCGAIVSITSGAGGTDAQDWAEMLERIILRFCELKKFKAKILYRQPGQEAGIKSSTFEVSGKYAYGWLKSEAGVHRLVRLSPFDSDNARHTSFALVDIIPDLGDIEEIKISEEDIRIDVFRSSGHGGQSVNTTDSAVRIVHNPTGITVTCQNERSQQQNKEMAMKILKLRIIRKMEQEREEEERKIRGELKSAEWGSQIRSYVIHPYKMVKDHRTGEQTSDVDFVFSGGIENFSKEYLKWIAGSRF